jgi:ceramide glucosyltransferase
MFAVWLHAWTATRVVWAQATIDTRAATGEADIVPARPIVKEEG